MPDAADNVYRTTWSPAEYLRQYYTTPPLTTDERHAVTLLADWLRVGPRVERSLEVGCGPVPYRAALLAPHADEIYLADYLPGNLAEVRLWRDDRPGQHDWDGFLREALTLEGRAGTDAETRDRKAELRRKITRLLACDLTQREPLGVAATYDLVASFYCAEAISGTVLGWERHVANLAGLVSPGGRMFVAAIRNARSYRVFDATFPAAPVDEGDWHRLLPALGFDPARTEIDVVAVPDFVAEGFDSVCVVRTQKAAA